MLVGHVAVGLAGKRIVPQVSLGLLVLAGVWADLLWCGFLIAGIEHVEIARRGARLMDSTVISQIGYSHGLTADLLWAVLLAALCFATSRNWKGALLIGAAVVSHWVLDVASHNPDMPLVPRSGPVFGLGLWNSIPATLLVEGGFWAVCIALYLRATKARRRIGLYAFWGGAILWTLAWYNNIAGPAPGPDMRSAAIGSLIFFGLIVLWACWIERLRTPDTDPRP
jgi:hypothetical protein